MSREHMMVWGAAALVGLVLWTKYQKASATAPASGLDPNYEHDLHVAQLQDAGTKCECADPKPGIYVPCDCGTPGAMVAESGY